MNILITGATGFMGRFLTKALEQEHKVTALSSHNCDLTLACSLEPFSERYDRIYHLAAWTQAGDFCLRHPGEQWLINQKINTNILSYWQHVQPQAKLICMGTSCSYAPGNQLREQHYLEGTPIDSLYTYAMTKRMLLVGLQALHKQFGLNYLYLIPSTLYGSRYHQDGRQLHFIFDLIRKILDGKEKGLPVVLWGDGHQKRELIHVEDFIDALLYLSDHLSNEIVNVGSGVERSIRDFAMSICDAADFPFDKIEFDESRHVGARSKVLNIEKLKGLYPRFQSRPLEEGIAETVAWFADVRKQQLSETSSKASVSID